MKQDFTGLFFAILNLSGLRSSFTKIINNFSPKNNDLISEPSEFIKMSFYETHDNQADHQNSKYYFENLEDLHYAVVLLVVNTSGGMLILSTSKDLIIVP